MPNFVSSFVTEKNKTNKKTRRCRRAKNGKVVYYDKVEGTHQGEIAEFLPGPQLIRYYLFLSE